MNTQLALQNWVEKYEPLKVQHQITDTLASCLNRKAKQKLGEYDLAVCATMREQILTDYGRPGIKEKVLDLLTKLERESKEMLGPEAASALRKKRLENGSGLQGRVSQGREQSKDDDDEEEVEHRKAVSPNKKTLNSAADGGGDFDEDSEGMEVLKEQMFAYSQELVSDLEARLLKHVGQETERVLDIHTRFRDSVEKRMGDQHSFLSEVKDELDRLSDRQKASHSELLSYNKGLSTSLKRMRGDQVVQEDDLNRAWAVFGMAMECLQQVLQHLDGSQQQPPTPEPSPFMKSTPE